MDSNCLLYCLTEIRGMKFKRTYLERLNEWFEPQAIQASPDIKGTSSIFFF